MWASRTAMLLLLALTVGALPLLGADLPIPIEGKLVVSSWDPLGSYYMTGSSDNRILLPVPGGLPSPQEDRWVWADTGPMDEVTNTPQWVELWVADWDGSGAVNLSTVAGLTGINCGPLWSPDGQQISFHHMEPAPGGWPCQGGVSIWVMDSDGTEAHRATPDSLATHLVWNGGWWPDGSRIVCGDSTTGEAFTIDTDGTDQRPLPVFGVPSRDGSRLLVSILEPGEVDGEPGMWLGLSTYHLDGARGQDLVMNFVSDAYVAAVMAAHGWTDPMRESSIRYWVGPRYGMWSPSGREVALGGSLTYDAENPLFDYENTSEVWVYNLERCDLTRLTNDAYADVVTAWNGSNTFPEDPEVTVDNTTITFGEVTGEGLTTIIRDDDPPPLPTGFGFAGEYYEIHTTAEVTGPIQVKMTYLDEDIPSGAEETLCLYHWNEETQTWEDITVSRDPVNNIVYGVTDSLSLFGLAMPIPTGRFSDVPATGCGPKGYHPYWAFYQIEACAEAGIVGGYPDGTYRPMLPVSRDQMAVFVSRGLAGGDSLVPTGPATATFTDVLTDYWAFKYIEYAVDNGVVGGYGDGTYRPGLAADRGQMAIFMARGMVGGEAYVPTGPEVATFPDVPTTDVAFRYVEYCKAEGVVGGYPDGTYRPLVAVTRDQMAVYVQRAFALPM